MNDIKEGVTYVFGENPDSPEWIADVVIYKNTPLFKDIFERIRNSFWSFIKKLIELFS